MTRVAWRALTGLLAVLLLVVVLTPFTERGSRALLDAADRLLPVDIQYGGGTLGGELRLARLAWISPDVEAVLQAVVVELRPACLWRSVICLRRLQARELALSLRQAPVTETQPPALDIAADEQPMLDFPVPLEIESLLIETSRVQWEGGGWRQGRFQAAVTASGSTIRVGEAVVADARLQLRNPEAEQAPADAGIELPQIELPLELLVDGLLLERLSWDVDGAQGKLQSLALRGAWRNTILQLDSLRLRSEEWGELSLEGELELARSWPLNLTAQLVPAEFPQWPDLLEHKITVSADGDLAALALRAELGGRVALSAQGELNALDPQLPFQLSLRGDWPQSLAVKEFVPLPDSVADLSLASPLLVTASGSMAEQVFKLTGSASAPGYQSVGLLLAGRHRDTIVTVEDLRLQDAAGANTLWGAGEVSLGEQLAWRLALESSGFDLPPGSEYASGRLAGRLHLSGSSATSDWQVAAGGIDVQGTVNGWPLLITGYTGLDSQRRLAPSDLRAELNGARMMLNASGESGTSAELELTVEDLGRWQPGGRGRLSLNAAVGLDWQQVTLTGSLGDIQWRGLKVDTGTIEGRYRPGAEHAFHVDVSLSGLAAAGIKLSAMQLIADGTEKSQAVILSSHGDVQAELALSGEITEQGDWLARLAPTVLQTSQGNWTLGEAVPIAWSGGPARLRVAAHCWQNPPTRICPGDLLLAEQGSGSLEVDGGIEFLAIVLPAEVEVHGDVQSRLAATWGPGTGPVLNGEIKTRDVRVTRHFGAGESTTVHWDSTDALLTGDEQGLQVSAGMYRDGGRKLQLDVQLPSDRAQPLSGALKFEGLQLSVLAPLAPNLSALEGEVTGGLRLQGTVDQPLAVGTVTLAGGHLAMVGNPTQLKALELVIDAQGDRADIRGTGLLGGGGLQLAGQLLTRPELRLELTATGGKHEILVPPATQLLVSEQLELTATSALLGISGRVLLHEGVLQHEQLPAGSVALSADVVEVDYAGNVIREDVPFDTRVNVVLVIEDKFKVVGDMVNVTLGGELQLMQEPARPLQLFGNLNIIGGELRAYQQLLRIKRGTISFSGPGDDPELDIRAEREIASAKVTVGVNLQGTLQQPLLEVFSDPVMPQGEVMSYLVRGRGMDARASADGLAMALSLGTGIANRSVLVAELNKIPGISNVAFGSEGTDEDMAATIGGYIGNRVYLSYGLGLFEPVNVLTARLYLRTRLWLEVVSRLENSVDLYYSFDID